VDDGLPIVPPWINAGWRRPFGSRPIMGSLSGRVRAGAAGDATRDRQKPWTHGTADPQFPSLAGQDKEGRLERIFGRVRIAEDRTARPEDHRAMPLHQDGEGQLGGYPVAVRKRLKELPVGLLSDLPAVEKRLDVLE
jgi:hypothetical protein